MNQLCNLHNPTRTSKILIVAGVFAVPGALGGVLVAVFTGGLSICLIAGIIVSAAIGATVEAWPIPTTSTRGVRTGRDGYQVTEIHMGRPIHELSEPKLHRHA